jgi:hypothetical protein
MRTAFDSRGTSVYANPAIVSPIAQPVARPIAQPVARPIAQPVGSTVVPQSNALSYKDWLAQNRKKYRTLEGPIITSGGRGGGWIINPGVPTKRLDKSAAQAGYQDYLAQFGGAASAGAAGAGAARGAGTSVPSNALSYEDWAARLSRRGRGGGGFGGFYTKYGVRKPRTLEEAKKQWIQSSGTSGPLPGGTTNLADEFVNAREYFEKRGVKPADTSREAYDRYLGRLQKTVPQPAVSQVTPPTPVSQPVLPQPELIDAEAEFPTVGIVQPSQVTGGRDYYSQRFGSSAAPTTQEILAAQEGDVSQTGLHYTQGQLEQALAGDPSIGLGLNRNYTPGAAPQLAPQPAPPAPQPAPPAPQPALGLFNQPNLLWFRNTGIGGLLARGLGSRFNYLR